MNMKIIKLIEKALDKAYLIHFYKGDETNQFVRAIDINIHTKTINNQTIALTHKQFSIQDWETILSKARKRSNSILEGNNEAEQKHLIQKLEHILGTK